MKLRRLTLILLLAFTTGLAACESSPGDKGSEESDADTDIDADTDSDSDADSDTDSDLDCEHFCEDIQAACPEDTKCLHSCEKASGELTEDNMDCAAEATDCKSTEDCWTGLY